MKVLKSKHIRIQITGLTSFAIIFSVVLCYFLGWDFEIESFLIALGILIGLLIAIWLLCFLLIKFEKQYFEIDNDQIALWKNNEMIFKLNKIDIIELNYLRFIWAFLFQMGSGYLNVTCSVDALTDSKFASIIMPNGTAIFSISMSKKQAKELSKILGKNVKIK